MSAYDNLSWMVNPTITGTNPTYIPPTQVMPRPTSSIVWVQGESGAKGYPVAPGNTVLLMDSESNKFYMKNIDTFGKPSIKTYVYEEEKPVQEVPSQNDYVSRKEFDELKQKLDELMS